VPNLGPVKRTILSIGAPLILGEMGGLMMMPSKEIIREYGIPASVIDEAYGNNPAWSESAAVALRKVRILCRELGLMNPVTTAIWKRCNIWQDDAG
jgi:hypothetical protein